MTDLRPLPFLAVAMVLAAGAAFAQAPAPAPPAPPPLVASSLDPALSIDLTTPAGMALLNGQWRTMEAKIVTVAPIPNAMAGYTSTYDISPHAGEAGYDDSAWPKIEAQGLKDRRGGGKVSFIWYRTALTIPAKIGDFDTTNTRVVLTVVVDDYAEVWVDGQMPRRAGLVSPGTVQGFNMPNRVVLDDRAKPGDTFKVAIFGINGPISVAPANFLSFREAHLDFYR